MELHENTVLFPTHKEGRSALLGRPVATPRHATPPAVVHSNQLSPMTLSNKKANCTDHIDRISDLPFNQESVSGLIKSLPNIQRLTLESYSYKTLYADIISPSHLISLKHLKLHFVNLDERGELLYIVSVLKGASNLVELVIQCNNGCIGCLCPCYLFGKNAEFLGSGTFLGSCVTHFILWSLFNTACCLLTDGLFLGLPGCLVSCYACGYRGILRSKKHRVEILLPIVAAICVLFVKSTVKYENDLGIPEATDMKLAVVTAPPVQTMQSDSGL
ncbi:hypothetical protein P8452_45375 [Trifolium repens]|nr:hypothetical protein P8452_45375 [Trifolium repens]